jgi:hypothetical protein
MFCYCINKIREYESDLEEDENDVAAFNRHFGNQGVAWPKTRNQNSQGNRPLSECRTRQTNKPRINLMRRIRIREQHGLQIANKQDTGKKNAGNEFEKTNLARTHKDDSTGQGST